MLKPVRHIGQPATPDELALLVEAMPERCGWWLTDRAGCVVRAAVRRGVRSCVVVTSI
ncbi:MAG: hypothetical protein IPL43_12005 [Micropruina sp.]|nr:hypothetical protein [Micropruina sp.]